MAVRAATKAKPKAKKPGLRERRKVAVAPRKPVKLSSEMRKYQDLLHSERQRLEAELQEIENRTARISESERASEFSSYEDHPADLASETFEREKDLAIGESVESLLNQVNTALEKIERGTFGVCDACRRPIKKARLQAIPFATLCVDCQGQLER
jgi:RNA polymerase-binding protein DksA